MQKILKNKKALIGIGVIILLLIGGVLWMRSRGASSETPEQTQKRRLSLPENIIPVAESPYISLSPTSDGRSITVTIHDLKKDAQELEYEIEYQTGGSSLQGFEDLLDLSQLPASATKLLGSCSAGGACTYHEDVAGGFFLGRFLGGSEDYALKTNWKYIDNRARESAHSSRDAKFQIDGRTLAQHRYLIIFNSPGYPEGIPGEVVSEIYTLNSSSALSGQANLTLRANEEGDLKIAAWNGTSWKTYEGTVDGKMITATVDLAQLYLVIR